MRCANRLWVVLQDYESLLTDFDDLEVEEIRRCRDLLIEKQAEIYDEAPRTSDKAYEKARDRLKNGHQSFEPGRLTNCCRRACVAMPVRNSVFPAGLLGLGCFPARLIDDLVGALV